MPRAEVTAVLEGLTSGRLTLRDLGARRLATYLGKTTGALYHHFGSLDGFLHAIADAGFVRLGATLTARTDGTPEGIAEAYLRFAFDHPSLYALMFDRPFDWTALRARCAIGQAPGVVLWRAFVARLEAEGGSADDARAIYGALHGLASLALSGRANIGDLETPDQEVAIRVARRLVRRILSTDSTDPQETDS